MLISAGSRFGPYEILAPLGAGGMGEVWKARDTRLSREVAIKVLPADLAADSERLRRFEKEARSASSLNHPAIITIYDIGRSDSIPYIAMELIEGTTLREMLGDGAIPVKKLLQIAAQVADGLAKAHSAGIIHRDLKPENVMVTKSGFAKILDFGLAKLSKPEAEVGKETEASTVSLGTEAGVIMGTVGYMSPEQARGTVVDFRSDQFSFGSVLYEMATGRPAFVGGSKPEILAAIIREEPESISSFNTKVPAPLSWMVERCLAKEPESRYASTEDLARDLINMRDRLSQAFDKGSSTVAPQPSRALRWAVLVAFFGTLAASFFFVRSLKMVPPAPPSFRRLTFRYGNVLSAGFAPDGQTIIYTAAWGWDAATTFSMRLGSVESRTLLPPGGIVPSVSSGGEMLVLRFSSQPPNIPTLARAALAGGAEREVLESVTDASWAPNGRDIAVVRINTDGKSPIRLEFPIGRQLVEGDDMISSPCVAPGGDMVAYAVEAHSRGGLWSLAVVDRQGRKRQLSQGFRKITGAHWAPRGNEVWFGGVPVDGTSAIYGVSLSGRQRALARSPGVLYLYDVSPDGRALVSFWRDQSILKALPPGESEERDLSWLLAGAQLADLSDDGKMLLFSETSIEGGPESVWLGKMDGSPAVRLGDGVACSLSPDGKWALTLRRQHPAQIVLLPTGAGESKNLANGTVEPRCGRWFPDGKRISFIGLEPGKGRRIYVQNLDGGGPKAISPVFDLRTPGRLLVSTDGVYARDASGSKYVMYPADGGDPAPSLGLRLQEGDIPLRWSADGHFLYVAQHGAQTSTKIFRLDASSGAREIWKEIAAQGRGSILLAADGKSYAYGYPTSLSDLYLIEGLR